jgi:hypothetical protein
MMSEPGKVETRKETKIMNKPKTNQHLRRKISALAVVGAMTVGAVLTLPTAQAGPPTPVSGTWEICDAVMSIQHQAGPNFIATTTQTQTFTGGALEGGVLAITADNPEQDLIRTEDGTSDTFLGATFHGSGTFTHYVLGSADGTAVMTYMGTLAADFTGVAYWVIDRGTGVLAGVHGQGTFIGSPPDPNTGCVEGTYDGRIQFAP